MVYSHLCHQHLPESLIYKKTDEILNAAYESINLRRNPLSLTDPFPALINGIKRVEQAA